MATHVANASKCQGRTGQGRAPPTAHLLPKEGTPPRPARVSFNWRIVCWFWIRKTFLRFRFVSFQFSSHSPSLPSLSLSLPLLPLLLLFILFCFCCCFVIVNHRNVSWVRVCVCFGASRVLGFVVSTQNLHSVVPLPLPSSSFHLSSAGPPLSPSDIFAPFCALLFRLFCGPLTWPEQVEPPDSFLPPQGALNTVRIAKHLQICSACLDYLPTYFHTSSPLMLLAPYVQVTHN